MIYLNQLINYTMKIFKSRCEHQNQPPFCPKSRRWVTKTLLFVEKCKSCISPISTPLFVNFTTKVRVVFSLSEGVGDLSLIDKSQAPTVLAMKGFPIYCSLTGLRHPLFWVKIPFNYDTAHECVVTSAPVPKWLLELSSTLFYTFINHLIELYRLNY